MPRGATPRAPHGSRSASVSAHGDRGQLDALEDLKEWRSAR